MVCILNIYKGKRIIVVYVLLLLPNNGNQKTTHEFINITEIISEINNIKELTEEIFPLN